MLKKLLFITLFILTPLYGRLQSVIKLHSISNVTISENQITLTGSGEVTLVIFCPEGDLTRWRLPAKKQKFSLRDTKITIMKWPENKIDENWEHLSKGMDPEIRDQAIEYFNNKWPKTVKEVEQIKYPSENLEIDVTISRETLVISGGFISEIKARGSIR